MGFYDRDYQRGEYYERQPGFHLGGPRTLTTNLVIVMFVIYAIQIITRGPRDVGWFTDTFRLHGEVLTHPYLAFQLLTYGFLHDVRQVSHILFNMIALWFFGRSVEYRYGKREYLTFFLVSVVISGSAFLIGEFVAHRDVQMIPTLVGASGAVSAVVILFCLNFPHQILYVWGVLPIPAWVLGVLYVGNDVFGAIGRQSGEGAKVAFTCHLGGALFALLYYQSGFRLERMLPSSSTFKSLQPKPKLKVHDPETAEETEEAVDEILKKIQAQGRDSLTRRERRILEEASREYQKKRR